MKNTDYVILAAGIGKRLRPLTDKLPKCLVNCLGKPLLDHQLAAVYSNGFSQVNIVGGHGLPYLVDYLEKHVNSAFSLFYNSEYDKTNMVFSLLHVGRPIVENCLKKGANLIVSYGDIAFSPNILSKLIESPHLFSTVIDRNWQTLWELRMDDPLSDVENLIMDGQNCILKIGGKPTGYVQVQGQYIGLSKFTPIILDRMVYEFDQMMKHHPTIACSLSMTDFFQYLINKGAQLHGILTNESWLELDSLQDLNSYECHKNHFSWAL
ncbi:MAG: phosphocholine cytidylyltransferase family protein [Chlamydiales bacterium]|jgi:choline kinase|nr:phosphocholine cytidylyltransferase family protein [Chlamydiales bacterium]